MKNKYLCALLCIMLCLNHKAFAQERLFGAFAGPQMTNVKYLIRGEKQPTRYKFGVQAGITWKMPIEGNLYFAPAFYYSAKGYKVTLNYSSNPPDAQALNNDTRLHTIDIAPLVNFDITDKPSHFFIKIGPSLDVILAGREKYELAEGGGIVRRKMVISFLEQYGRVAASAILHVGYEGDNGVFIFGHYAHGIGSMNNQDFGPKIFNNAFGISIGKYFNKTSSNPLGLSYSL
ncbi:MAG: porin family protein [Chitinophagaceae bacterium]